MYDEALRERLWELARRYRDSAKAIRKMSPERGDVNAAVATAYSDFANRIELELDQYALSV
jgi:hypothetical protein